MDSKDVQELTNDPNMYSKASGNGGGSEKIADDLITGTLKKPNSYHSDYGRKTVEELESLSKSGDRKAKQMLKLVKQHKQLNSKLGGKSK